MSSSIIRRALALGSSIVVSAASVFACVQGEKFHPAKPLSTVALPALPPLPGAANSAPLKFEAPRLEPLKLDGLLSIQPLGPAKPVTQAAAPVNSGAVTTKEQHEVFVQFVREFEARQADAARLGERIDYSVALIRLGRYADAIAALSALEQAHPGRYEIAANLGTAHELAGNLEDAVLWIARGLERNPESHHGTEWLHVAILRTKLKLRDNPRWLEEHSVLEGTDARSDEEIVRAIDYQLGERLQFVKPPDAIVCDLFYQAARRVAGDGAESRRAHYLRESLRFGDWRKAEIARTPKT